MKEKMPKLKDLLRVLSCKAEKAGTWAQELRVIYGDEQRVDVVVLTDLVNAVITSTLILYYLREHLGWGRSVAA